MTSLRLAVCALTVVLLGGMTGTAQAQPADDAQGRIAGVRVTDTGVQFVYSGVNLPGDAGLDVGSVEATFTPEGQQDPVPLEVSSDVATVIDRRVVLALDVSGSLGDDGIAAVRAAATALVEQLPDGTKVGLVVFDQPARVVLDPTADRAAVLQALAGLERAGNTALYDAVSLATDMLTGDGSELVLVMTDGRDEGDGPGTIGSQATVDEAAARVQASGAAVTAVAFGDADLTSLQVLADAGGGQAVVSADDSDALTSAFQAVAEDIATELLVDATLPEEVRGVPGTLLVTAVAGGRTVAAQRQGTLGAPVTAPPAPTPTPTPSADASEAAVPAAPPSADVRAVSSVVLYLAVGAMFFSLLVASAVFVGLLVRRSSPEAARERSLAVYSLRGSNPSLLSKEPAPTKLGDSAVARSAVELAGRVVERRGVGERLGRRLESGAIPLRAAEWTVLVVASMLAFGALLFLLSGANGLALVVGLVIGAIVPSLVLAYRKRKRERAFMEVLPDTLGLMASGLRAGYSMPQAMDSVGREGQEPLKSEFNRALVEARLGVPPEDAMEGIADRMGSKDFRWVVMAIRIQREVGGNLAELLDTVAATLRERARLKRQVDTLSAEGRLSAWILGAMPVLFGLYLLLTQPEYLGLLYQDPLGIALLILGLVMFGIGVLGLRWAVKVDV